MADADWIRHWGIIWRSELRALAEDRELREAEASCGDAAARAWPAPSPRPSSAAVPPGAGSTAGDVARLARRVDELEQRLIRLDAAAGH